MGITAGITVVGSYTAGATAGLEIDKLLDLIPNPDVRESPNPRAANSILDQMSPMAAAQLRVELNAIKAAIGAYNAL